MRARPSAFLRDSSRQARCSLTGRKDPPRTKPMNEEHAAPSMDAAGPRPAPRPRERTDAEIQRGLNLFILAAASFLRDASETPEAAPRTKKRAAKRRSTKAD